MAREIIRIIAVGRVKTKPWKEAIALYASRLKHFCEIKESLIKDADSSLPKKIRIQQEGQAILSSLGPRDIPICLDEQGLCYTSKELASALSHFSENANQQVCFIIGGAYGLDEEVRKRAKLSLALGRMTFPHELARVILYEQIYRAKTIQHRIAYHNE